MTTYELIMKKRSGTELEPGEIEYLLKGFLKGEIADYQMSAFMMATFFNGMTERETEALTRAMLDSGTVLDLSDVEGYKADKHSTGGVGDKLSLIVAPVAAASGLKVPMMSGRGLGHTGGTLDKLESIPGMRTALSPAEFKRIVSDVGMAIAGQSPDMAPADQKTYALRDVTATIECVPLIVSSILSKKLAAGVDGLVLDVKVGRGAFMPDRDSGKRLARSLLTTGRALGLRVSAVLTDMESPLGTAVGNALEVREAVHVLEGGGPSDVRALSVELAARMLRLAGRGDLESCRAESVSALDSGRALRVFSTFVEAQGGDPRFIGRAGILPEARFTVEAAAPDSGFVAAIDALEIGSALVGLGAGRASLGDSIDPAVGIEITAAIGAKVERGDPLALIHANDRDRIDAARARIRGAFRIGPTAPAAASRIIEEAE